MVYRIVVTKDAEEDLDKFFKVLKPQIFYDVSNCGWCCNCR